MSENRRLALERFLGPVAVLSAFIPLGALPLSQWLSLGPIGSIYASALDFAILPLLFVLASAGVIACLLFFAVKERRYSALALLVGLNSGLGICFGSQWAEATRRHFFLNLTTRAQPLVSAIHQYERDRGIPPKSLDELVPDYLKRVPHTGMPAYPGFRISEGNSINRDRWALMVSTPTGFGLNFDEFVYYPSRRYPSSYERIGDWAYIHE